MTRRHRGIVGTTEKRVFSRNAKNIFKDDISAWAEFPIITVWKVLQMSKLSPRSLKVVWMNNPLAKTNSSEISDVPLFRVFVAMMYLNVFCVSYWHWKGGGRQNVSTAFIAALNRIIDCIYIDLWNRWSTDWTFDRIHLQIQIKAIYRTRNKCMQAGKVLWVHETFPQKTEFDKGGVSKSLISKLCLVSLCSHPETAQHRQLSAQGFTN